MGQLISPEIETWLPRGISHNSSELMSPDRMKPTVLKIMKNVIKTKKYLNIHFMMNILNHIAIVLNVQLYVYIYIYIYICVIYPTIKRLL